jgi:EAL domain-containing protein (putative c-di-GMP-specific phosphodiesterase class I)
VVVLADIAHESEIAAIARKILDALFVPVMMDGQELSPVGSIGIAVFPRDGDNATTLLANADAAMYRVKEMGCGNFQFYQPSMNTRALERLKLESGLRRALERNEFVLHYQPQIDIPSGAIIGVEALLRWQPPGRPMVHPGDFIPIAEETGLIVPIGEWVLRTACAQQVAWKNAGLRDIRMAVNLSARQFKQQDLHEMVANVLVDTQCRADHLELEITESVVMDNPEAAAATLQSLTDMGIQLSIDDFGTGYSSLSYLKRFPIHSLKIDRSFVCDIPADSNDAAIATAVIALAHSMKLKVVAEGVETIEQLDFLRERQCDAMQGFLCGRPMPSDQIASMLEK